jgi:predicted AlkP superfamily phosphohydrolase/phosphomutase
MTHTLFIGLDGATFDVLDDLVAAQPGRAAVMPFLGTFMARGFRTRLRSTPHPLTPPAWTSMITGRTPGHHGVFDFMRTEDKGKEVFFTLYDFRDIRAETIWSIASRQQRSVAALNFPMMAPPPKVNGSLIPGFTSWRHLRRNSVPESLFDRLSAIDGFNPKALAWDFERENEIGNEMSEEHLKAWVGYPREEGWYKVARFLLEQDRPHLMAVMFDGTDKIQHQAWKYIHPALRSDDPADAPLQALCMEYFRRLDRYIQGLVELAGPDTQVFMASDHGFTASTEVVRINRYLSELGYLTYHEVPNTDAGRRRANSPFAFLDWDRTVAYCPTPSSNGIHIRVAQEPGQPGIPAADYYDFRDRLIGELYALKAPGSDEPVIQKVLTREEIFPGQAMESAPDLTLVLRDYGFVSIRNLAPVVVPRQEPSGTHHPDGVFMAAGPGIRPGVEGERLQITDVAAILLYSLGLPIPDDFEGRVPHACFQEDHLHAHPVHFGPATQHIEDGEQKESTVSDSERRKILDQLAQLGYLEE